MSSYVGNRATGSTISKKFVTLNGSDVPTTLAGSPVLSVYKDSDLTESTAGVTLTADFDGVTGLNNVVIDTSTDTVFYAAGSDFDVVIAAGTVDGSSVVGTPVLSFSLGGVPIDGTSFDPSALTAIQGEVNTALTLFPAAKVADVAAVIAAIDALNDISGAEVADALLGRNIAGGADGGRTVTSALRRVRNRNAIVAGTLTTYQEDDATPDHTAAVQTAPGDPIVSVDPA